MIIEALLIYLGTAILIWPTLYAILAFCIFLISFGVPKPIVGIPFYILDIIVNWYVSGILLDPPRKLDETISKRMERYKKGEDGKRKKFAYKICSLINQLMPNHC